MKTIPLRKILNRDKLIRPRLTKIVKRYESYTCGIPPMPPPPKMPPPPPVKFPDALTRPPCYPGQTIARHGPCSALAGLYCPAEKVKYVYPPFSENIDFVPSGSPECWWAAQPRCELDVNQEDLPFRPT